MEGDAPRGERYDRRFDELAARGVEMHGEADLVDSYLTDSYLTDSYLIDSNRPTSVLDAGCGTGRVAIELSRRGRRVVGVDMDPSMLEVARRKAPHVPWVEGDLADPHLVVDGPFDVVVLAGNVLIFVAPGTEGDVIANMASCLGPAGRLISGYSLRPGTLSVAVHDELSAQAGLVLEDRWSTWDRLPFDSRCTYAVSVHRHQA
jgi:SAM-dependent methyltransferase